MPSDLKEGGTGIGWRDRHCGSPGSRAERGAARVLAAQWGSPQRPLRPPARRLPVLCPFPAGVTASAHPCSILESLLALAGPASLGSNVCVGPRPLGSVPWEEPQGELHQEGLRGAGRAEPRASRGRLGGLGSLSGAGRRSCEVVPVRRARQMARAGTSRPSGVGVLTAGLSAALTALPRWDGAFSRARCPPASPRQRRAAPGGPWCFCVNGDPAGSSSFQIPSKWTASASLSEPNDESGANVDASKMWRDDREQFYKIARQTVQKSLGL